MIDDDRIAIAVVQAALRDRPWSVTSCGDAASARVHLGSEPWDVVLVDLDLGDASGAELVRRHRSEEAGSSGGRAGVVAMTAHRDPTILRDAIDAGCDGVLVKPIAAALLREALARFARTDTPPPAPAVPTGAELAAELAGDVDALIAQLDAARTGDDCEALRRVAHRLAGTAGSIDRHALGEAAREVERAAAGGHLEDARRAAARALALTATRLHPADGR